jgi:hypothetical protein
MKCNFRGPVGLAVGLLALAGIAAAGVPHQMHYQGHLTDSGGAPLDTTVSMTFTIYDDSSVSGTVWWTETQPNVTVSNGLFSVLLGSQNGIPDTVFRDTTRWLGIQIGFDPEIAPRTKLVTVPYAFRVATVGGATGGVISGDVSIQSDLAVSGKATIGPDHASTGTYAFVAGSGNNASGEGSTISGGYENTASGTYSPVVGGGRYNTASGRSSTVSGGYGDTASADYATVGGGLGNSASNEDATVGGGSYNVASGPGATIGGGAWNVASGSGATVSGGVQDTASGSASNVCGGNGNHASGLRNTVLGGYKNSNAGEYCVVLGGLYDTLTSDARHSLAFGQSVYVDGWRRIVFFHGGESGRIGLNRDDRDSILYPIHVGTDGGSGNGAYLTWGGTWTNGSSRSFKENFQPLDSEDLLAKISGLPVEAWQYKDSDERHIGPVSEDFAEAFDVGTLRNGTRDERYLSPGDVAGVALAGVKELIQENEELRQTIQELRQRISKLEGAGASKGGK